MPQVSCFVEPANHLHLINEALTDAAVDAFPPVDGPRSPKAPPSLKPVLALLRAAERNYHRSGMQIRFAAPRATFRAWVKDVLPYRGFHAPPWQTVYGLSNCREAFAWAFQGIVAVRAAGDFRAPVCIFKHAEPQT